MNLPKLHLKKNEDKRIRNGHLWVYSNEIDNYLSPLKNFKPGQEVELIASDKSFLGIAYVNPHSLLVARLFSRELDTRLNHSFFIEKIQKALHLRNYLFDKPFYRLVFSESDFIPGLIIDRFNQTFVLQMNTAGMEYTKETILAALKEVFPEANLFLRNDSSARLMEGLDRYIACGMGEPPSRVLLEENAGKFYAPIQEGQKTGWFYDHRVNREKLAKYVPQKRVLDVFSYVGAWGIQAILMGAREVLCIDSSKKSADLIYENATLNQIEKRLTVYCEDAFVALKNLNHQKEKFDVIILDPPAFIKKIKDKNKGYFAYQRLNEAALRLLSDEGILVSCSCSMHLSHEDLVGILKRSSLAVGIKLQILERGHQAPDHPIHMAIPETDYLKMVVVRNVGENKTRR